MKPSNLLSRLHARLGDFWWYSLMLFCACRAADALNVFVGLWLVPKYVEPSELGAVMPLTNLANFLAIPIAVFVTNAALLLVTGYGYFTAYIPTPWTNFLATHNITSLSAILWWMTGSAILKALGCALAMLRQKAPSTHLIP